MIWAYVPSELTLSLKKIVMEKGKINERFCSKSLSLPVNISLISPGRRL